MENKIISIDITPDSLGDEYNGNAGVMWEHNATVLKFNIDPAFVGDYRYYIEYRSLMGTKVRTEYLDLNTETNTVTYSIPVTMSSLKGVECYFNIVSIDEDGNTVQVIKPEKFCLTFDFSPDTDNSLAKVNDFSINALLEAIRLGTFKGDKGEKGDKGDKGDKGETGGISEEYATRNFANAVKGFLSGKFVTADDVSPVEHPIDVFVRGKNLFDVSKIENTSQITNNGDGTLIVAANAYSVNTGKKLCDLCPQLRVGDVCTLSLNTTSGYTKWIYLSNLGKTWNVNTSLTITEDLLNSEVLIYGMHTTESTYGQETVISDIQIELGDTATEYISYVDPSAVMLKRCGKNLFDGEWETGGIDTATGENISGSSNLRTVNYIPVANNAAHYFSLASGVSYFPVTYDKNYNFVSYKGMKSGSFVLTTEANECYVRLMQYNNTVAPANVQVEIGNTATEYEEYKGVTTHIPHTDGTVDGATSAYPTTVVLTDNENVTVDIEYNKDTNKVIEKLVNAIVSLGGNV